MARNDRKVRLHAQATIIATKIVSFLTNHQYTVFDLLISESGQITSDKIITALRRANDDFNLDWINLDWSETISSSRRDSTDIESITSGIVAKTLGIYCFISISPWTPYKDSVDFTICVNY